VENKKLHLDSQQKKYIAQTLTGLELQADIFQKPCWHCISKEQQLWRPVLPKATPA